MRRLALALALTAPALAAEKTVTPVDAATLTALEWEARPIVLFAPTADHPRLVEARRAIDAARAGFDDRDMRLVVVTGDRHPALRERFDVAPDAFVAFLIGKDGGVKERADRLASLDGWFARVDRMPMRLREQRERRETAPR